MVQSISLKQVMVGNQLRTPSWKTIPSNARFASKKSAWGSCLYRLFSDGVIWHLPGWYAAVVLLLTFGLSALSGCQQVWQELLSAFR